MSPGVVSFWGIGRTGALAAPVLAGVIVLAGCHGTRPVAATPLTYRGESDGVRMTLKVTRAIRQNGGVGARIQRALREALHFVALVAGIGLAIAGVAAAISALAGGKGVDDVVAPVAVLAVVGGLAVFWGGGAAGITSGSTAGTDSDAFVAGGTILWLVGAAIAVIGWWAGVFGGHTHG
jgi:hypothetical protein